MSPLIDATSVVNPYAASDRPRLAPAVEVLAQRLDVPEHRITVTAGARTALQSLMTGPVLFSVPTSPAYFDLAQMPVIVHQLCARENFRLDLEALERTIRRLRPQTVVIANPSNPDGNALDPWALIGFLSTTRANHVIVDETFAPFAGLPTLAPLVREFPHLSVVGSLRPSHALELGYVVSALPPRGDPHRLTALPDDAALRTYVDEARAFQSALTTIPGTKQFPSRANFSLLATYRPAKDVIAALEPYGVKVSACADAPNCTRYLRICARTADENWRVLHALRQVLALPLMTAA